MRILLPADLDRIEITMAEAIDAVRSAFADAGRDPLLAVTRHRVHTPSGVRVSVHQGAPVSLGATGLMAHSELVKTSGADQDYAGKHAPVYVLFDAEGGDLLALLVGFPQSPHAPKRAISGLRAAATSALGTQLLAARRDRLTLGIFGSGEQARYHLLAFAQVLPLARVLVISRRREHCEAFLAEMQPHLPEVPLEIAPSPAELLARSDVVLTATNSNVPVFDGSLLRPGQHVTSIVGGNFGLVAGGFLQKNRREIDDATIERADVIVVTSTNGLRVDRQADIFEHAESGRIAWERIRDLGDLVMGRAGRTSDAEITLFKNNAGQGIADVAIGMLIYRKAVAAGLGTEVLAPA